MFLKGISTVTVPRVGSDVNGARSETVIINKDGLTKPAQPIGVGKNVSGVAKTPVQLAEEAHQAKLAKNNLTQNEYNAVIKKLFSGKELDTDTLLHGPETHEGSGVRTNTGLAADLQVKLPPLKGRLDKTPDRINAIFNPSQVRPGVERMDYALGQQKGYNAANEIRFQVGLDQASQDAGNNENLFHHQMDPQGHPLTTAEEKAADVKAKQLAAVTEHHIGTTRLAEGRPEPSYDNKDYQHLISEQDIANARFEAGERNSPLQSANKKTTSAMQHPTYIQLRDPATGERRVADVGSEKDERGHATGGQRVHMWGKDENTGEKSSVDIGGFKTKSKEELMNKELKPLQRKLSNLDKEAAGIAKVRVSGGDATAQISALSRRFSTINDRELTSGLTTRDRTTLRTIEAQAKALDKVPTVKSNQWYKLAKLMQAMEKVKGAIKDVESNYDKEELKDRIFVDKTGKKWDIVNRRAEEIESVTDTKYLPDALRSNLIAAADSSRAAASATVKEFFRTDPEVQKEMVEIANQPGGKIPAGWTTIKDPSWNGYAFSPEAAKVMARFANDADIKSTNGLVRAANGINRMAIQFIVMNPLIHGSNLFTQALIKTGSSGNPLFDVANHPILGRIPGGPLNTIGFIKNIATTLASSEDRMEILQNYLRDGGHIDAYGKNEDSILTGLTHGANKINAKAMSGIDTWLRISTYANDMANGVDPAKSVRDIDTFFGRKDLSGPLTNNVLMFAHWLKTQGIAMGNQAIHPIAFAGSTINAGILYEAIQLGVNKLFQEVTGNKNANIKMPGELGMAKDIGTTINDLIHHNQAGASTELLSELSSHVSPLAQAAGNQIYGKTLYQGANLSGAKGRLESAGQSLIAPSQNIGKIAAGKMSFPEMIANEYFGLHTPHAGGSKTSGMPANYAAPNFKNIPGLKSFNVHGATAAPSETGIGGKKISDVTGYQQEENYFTAKTTLTSTNMNAGAKSAVADFLNKNKTSTGETIENSPAQTEANWKELAANPDSLPAMQKFYQQGGSHNPEWDLTGSGTINGQSVSKMQLWATYKALPPGDLQKAEISAQNPWILQTENASQSWDNAQVFGNTAKNAGYVPYPTIPASTETMMTNITNLAAIPAANRTQAQIAQLSALENSPIVQAAYNTLDTYTNSVRKSMDLPEINYAPNAPPDVANFTTQYMNSSTSGRSSMRTKYPTLYSQMENSLSAQSLSTAEKDLGQSYYGAPVSNSALGAVYGLGQYDIAKTANPNGTSSYSINPAAAYAQNSSSGYSSSGVVKAQIPSSATDTKLISALKSSTKGMKGKKIATKASKSYNIKKMPIRAPEKQSKQVQPRKPSSISSDGLIKYGV